MTASKKAGRLEYGEEKIRVNLSLTPTAVQKLDSLADRLQLNRSEVVEQFARGILPSDPTGLNLLQLGERFAV